MDRKALAKIYSDYLAKEGYRPEVDEVGFVAFKKEGGLYLIQPDEDDEEYFCISFPNFWEIEDEGERERALVACNQANMTAKVAKLAVVEDNVWGTVELFLGEVNGFKPVFERALGALQNGVQEFVERMKAEKKEA